VKTKIQSLLFFLSFVGPMLLSSSCTNDNLVDLSKRTNDTTLISDTTTAISPSPGPTASTDTTVSFSKKIKPILVRYNCANCHGNYYESFAGASSLAKSGQLYGTMSWASGYRRMPPGQKASAAELTLISTWIKQGTSNN
jgi:hypothetical protein